MTTTVSITISDQRPAILGGSTSTPRTEITVTWATHAQAIAAALVALAGAHRTELESAWADLRTLVGTLIADPPPPPEQPAPAEQPE